MGHKYRRKNQRRRLDRRTKGMTQAQRRGWRPAEQTGRGDIIPASFADDHLLPLPRSVFRR